MLKILTDIALDGIKEEARETGHEKGYQTGYLVGYEDAKTEAQSLLAKKALDLYTNQNWLVNPNQVFQVTKTGIPYLGQEPITKEKLKELQRQAQSLLEFDLWAVLTTLIRQRAIDLAVKTSQNWDNVIGGKMMVHNISLIENLVKYISEVDINSIPEHVGKKSPDVL